MIWTKDHQTEWPVDERFEAAAREQAKLLAALGRRFGQILVTPRWPHSGEDALASEYFAQIRQLPVRRLAASEASVLLWTPGRDLERSLALLEVWRLRYVTSLLCVPSYDGNGASSLLLIAVRGKPRLLSQWLPSAIPCTDRDGHPDQDILRAALEVGPKVARLHLLGREPSPGWTVVPQYLAGL